MNAIPTPQHFVRKSHGYTQAKVEVERSGNEAEEKRIALSAWNVLQKHYPGHGWRTRVDVFQGFLLVELPLFSDWQEFVRLREITSHNAFEQAVKDAGGRWLEHYRLPRSGMDLDDFKKALTTWRPDFTRKLKPPE